MILLIRTRRPLASISLDAGLLEAIDEEARRRGLTRSAFLASATIDKIENVGMRSDHQPSRAGPLSGGFAEAGAKEPDPGGEREVASVG
jgi:hypothetical protein